MAKYPVFVFSRKLYFSLSLNAIWEQSHSSNYSNGNELCRIVLILFIIKLKSFNLAISYKKWIFVDVLQADSVLEIGVMISMIL